MDVLFLRHKLAFWGFASLLIAITAVPSAVLMRAARRYHSFLTGSAPGTIRPTKVDFLDRRNDTGPTPDKNLAFEEFRIPAPKAKTVELIGDFNGWKTGTIAMRRSGKNWEVILPLPPGRYRYLFLVDGQAQFDPKAPSETGSDGKQTSLRSVP
ncbi:MAG: glycogen-binding domain-containing protein [Elusimicrobiota bacterium]|jgi:hypothetical protein